MSSTWASVVPAGKVPKDTTPTTSTASLPVLARRFLADPHEIGRFEGIGPDLWELGAASTRAQRRPRAGHCRRLWERRLELGANTYRVLVHPISTTAHPRLRSWRGVVCHDRYHTSMSRAERKCTGAVR